MGRKSKSFLEELFELIVDVTKQLPWWLSIIIGAVAALSAYGYLDAKIEESSPFAMVSWALPLVLLMPFLVGAGASFSARQKIKPTKEQSSPEKSVPTPEVVTFPELSLENIKLLAWQRWEILCSNFCKHLGYDARWTGYGADGGIDIHIHNPDTGDELGIAQCKAWSKPVGVKEVRELYGIMQARDSKEGIFFTTSHFTNSARTFASEVSIDLIDGVDMIDKLREFPVDARQELREIAFEGDYTRPYCASCGIPMITRYGKDGGEFWGCENFPRCRSKLRKR